MSAGELTASWADVGVFFQTYIHIIDQKTRKPVPTKFYTDPMVVFHHVNAYEEDGCVLFDVIAYEDNSLYQLFYLANLNKDFEEKSRLTSVPTLRRFAVPLHVDKVLRSEDPPCSGDHGSGQKSFLMLVDTEFHNAQGFLFGFDFLCFASLCFASKDGTQGLTLIYH